MPEDFKKISPRAIWLFFIVYLVRLSIIPVAIIFYSILTDVETENVSAFRLSFIVNLLAWVFAAIMLAKIAHNNYRYILESSYFQKDSGLFGHHSVTIPYEMIKHIDTDQSLVERLFGLARLYLNVESGLHKKSEGYILGLTIDNASKLKEELISRAHISRSR